MKKALLFTFSVVSCTSGCQGEIDQSKQEPGKRMTTLSVDEGRVAARVNGTPIPLDAVREAVDAHDGGLSVSEAVQLLTTQELLSEEANRRGFGNQPEVEDARKMALARVMLKTQIGEGVTAEGLNKDKLRKYYELHKKRFQHGIQRRVSHFLALTGKKGMSEERAKEVAFWATALVGAVDSSSEFKKKLRPLLDEFGEKVKIEDLPPFEIANSTYVKPFVEAAFAVPRVGTVSPPTQTKVGWHVIYVSEEIPAINLSYEQVEDTLAQEVLPTERRLRTDALLERLRKEKGVFYYEDILKEQVPTP